jgi:hypothetical protein
MLKGLSVAAETDFVASKFLKEEICSTHPEPDSDICCRE